MKKTATQYLVIGCGRFGTAVATSLFELGQSVMVVDDSEEAIEDIADKVTHSAILDVTDEGALRSIGISNFDVVIVAISSNFKASILATLIAKEYGVQKIICKVADEIQARVLYKIGADRVIMPDRDMGKRLVQNLVSHNILDQISLGENYAIYEVHVPQKWLMKSLEELDLRRREHINVIAIKRENQLIFNLSPTFVFQENDIVVVAGECEIVNHFAN